MATLDIFNGDAFSMVEMTTAINRQPYTPQYLRNLNMFQTKRIRTKAAAIEEVDGTLHMIGTSQRGAAPERRSQDKRKVHYVEPPRLALADTIYADEIQSIRAFGSETELKQVMSETATRFSRMRNDLVLTSENHMLGAVQGVVYDKDGTTEIVNWFTTFGITQDAEIDFDLDAASPASGAVRKNCTKVVRQTLRGMKLSVSQPGMQIIGLCGDAFWDDLTAHSEVRETYLSQSAANQLRDGLAFDSLSYGGITFINYRSTDDGSTLAVGTDECKFFPAASGMFEQIFAPGEWFDVVNTPGQEFYALTIPDMKRNAKVDLELYSYPLYVCTRPKALQRAKRT